MRVLAYCAAGQGITNNTGSGIYVYYQGFGVAYLPPGESAFNDGYGGIHRGFGFPDSSDGLGIGGVQV
jgi:hypothetical protein